MLLRCQDVKMSRSSASWPIATRWLRVSIECFLYTHLDMRWGKCRLEDAGRSDTKIIWGCFIVSICTFMIRPFLSFSQDWSDRFVKSADFSYCSRQVFEIGWGVNPSEKLEVPIRASNSFLVCFHNFITMQLLRRIAENLDYKAPLLIFGGATRYFENSMQ